MKTYINPARQTWNELCLRSDADSDAKIEERVKSILARVKADGDSAVYELSRLIDNVDLQSMEVSEEEFEEAESLVSCSLKEAVKNAYHNIHYFHSAQIAKEIVVETSPGIVCRQRPVPIRRVGLYIPGGTAPLFSTVLMLAIPAAVAGCSSRIMCTPCCKDGKVAPAVLYAARLCGIDHVYKIGGAQAIAAMAYGTESVAKVDKIFGPGNRYVTIAKTLVSSEGTAIDMPAGPSEVMVLADQSSNPSFVASDLLSQAEHGRDSQVILVCNDESVASAVMSQVERQAEYLPRGEYIASSLESSRAVVFDNMQDMVDFANCYAPEHLIIQLENADEVVDGIYAAGSVFVGAWTPESAGDYASGTNHTLPTSGWARSYSGVNLDSFIRKMTIQTISREGLALLSDTIVNMAEAEGLEAHANAVEVRMKTL